LRTKLHNCSLCLLFVKSNIFVISTYLGSGIVAKPKALGSGSHARPTHLGSGMLLWIVIVVSLSISHLLMSG
jgi:hypothetical protein